LGVLAGTPVPFPFICSFSVHVSFRVSVFAEGTSKKCVHRPASITSKRRNAAITDGKWNLTHLFEMRTTGIFRSRIQLSILRVDAEMARAQARLSISPTSIALGPP
jgi:hypothetical protein